MMDKSFSSAPLEPQVLKASLWFIPCDKYKCRYRKIPKISPGAYIIQTPFFRGLFLEGLIFGGAYLRREICVSKSIELAL